MLVPLSLLPASGIRSDVWPGADVVPLCHADRHQWSRVADAAVAEGRFELPPLCQQGDLGVEPAAGATVAGRPTAGKLAGAPGGDSPSHPSVPSGPSGISLGLLLVGVSERMGQRFLVSSARGCGTSARPVGGSRLAEFPQRRSDALFGAEGAGAWRGSRALCWRGH